MLKTQGLQPVYVLHRRSYGDSSLLVDLFSRDHGRLSVLARGAKQGKSAKTGLLQPFVPLLASWRGRGSLPTLSNVEAASAVISLTGRQLFCGLYLNELLMRLLQSHDPHLTVFAIYSDVIKRLGAEPEDDLLRQFELTLLQEMGFGLLLDREAGSGAPILPANVYHYQIETGPVPAYDEHLLRFHGETLLRLARHQPLDERSKREARVLMRHLLQPYLGDKPLKSRELFRRQVSEQQQ